MYSIPDGAVRPDPAREYRILFNITKAAASPDRVNPGLEHVARLVNIFALANVPPRQTKIVAVMHGPATAISLDDQHYQDQHKLGNPNSKMIEALKRAGVTLYVCGQALAQSGFPETGVNREVEIALAALTVLAVYQLDGYALIPE